MKTLQSSRDAALDQNEKAYAEIVLMADRRRGAVRELIREQEKAAVSQAEALVDLLEKEISELKKAEEVMKEISHTKDHIHFLQHCQPFFEGTEPESSSAVSIDYHIPFDFVSKAISDLRNKMENMTKAMVEISKTIEIDLNPKTRQELSIYSCCLKLDPNTAFENLLISEGNKRVTWTKRAQQYPFHPERFTKYDQVLCTEALSGVCYWEFEWRGPRAEVAVCYKGPELDENGFGYTDQSWCLSVSNSDCSFWHDENKYKISGPCSSTVGVFLNQRAGNLSFFSVSEGGEMTLLHRVQTTFIQPLYPGFMVSKGASVRILPPK